MTNIRDRISAITRGIDPYDDVELAHQNNVLSWVASGAPLFRIKKPDNPPKHLVSYFVPYDARASKVMLVDHIKAQLWLPPGGHVDLNEDPQFTVVREAMEELNITARFDTVTGDKPLFVTVTKTKGIKTHTDVSLWYVVSGDSQEPLLYDREEMTGYRWLTLKDVLSNNISELDPQMHRFASKLQRALTASL